jgi:hypothetical protein
MVKAYIGTASYFGLESFLSESENDALVMIGDVENVRIRRRVHYWAAVSDDVATQIQEYLRAGDRRQALLTLDALATDITPLDRFGGRHRRAA